MSSFAHIIGNVGKDLHRNKLEDGRTTFAFSLASRDREKDQDGEYETSWFRVIVTCPASEKALDFHTKAIATGNLVGVNGRLKVQRVEKDGKTYTNVTCFSNDFILLAEKQVRDDEVVGEPDEQASPRRARRPTVSSDDPSAAQSENGRKAAEARAANSGGQATPARRFA